ncbi:MAG: FliM/FliN family flagellar motor switch protein [Nitrospirae bacterium]|nr:FliM/FliN family flagellar motor switch protein [Candidatus Troglogloeales bacterium]MBI3597945.1 FliM/FliN family flagellar motor switch protein [Candidatus Troglogloeales bacterium]
MAEPVLSQEEMDALLKGVQGGQVDTQVIPNSSAGALRYDLTDVNRYVTLSPAMTLKVVSDRFIPHLQAAIGKAIRREVTVTAIPVQTLKFGSVMSSIQPMSSLNLLKMDPLTERGLLVMTGNVVYFLLDHFLGGKGKLHLRDSGSYTMIEMRFVQRIVDLILCEFEKAWQPIHKVTISLTRTDCNTRNMRVLPDKDLIVKSGFHLEINGYGEEFFFCFPFAHFDRLRKKIFGGPGGEIAKQPEASGIALKNHLTEGCFVAVSACLGEAILTVPEIIDLAVGDVVMLDQNSNEDLKLRVEGSTKFYGQPGAYKGKRAFQIRSIAGAPLAAPRG